MPFELEWRMWRQLRGAFEVNEFIFVGEEAHEGYSFRQAETMTEALAVLPENCQRVFLEPSGFNPISAIPQDGHIAIIVGNTEQSNVDLAVRGEYDETYCIWTPNKTHLYGTNAAAIALAMRYGQ